MSSQVKSSQVIGIRRGRGAPELRELGKPRGGKHAGPCGLDALLIKWRAGGRHVRFTRRVRRLRETAGKFSRRKYGPGLWWF